MCLPCPIATLALAATVAGATDRCRAWLVCSVTALHAVRGCLRSGLTCPALSEFPGPLGSFAFSPARAIVCAGHILSNNLQAATVA